MKAVEKAREGRQDTVGIFFKGNLYLLITNESKLKDLFLQEERGSLLKELKDLREERSRLLAQLEKYKDCDPEVIEDMSEYRPFSEVLITLWSQTGEPELPGLFSLIQWN